MKKLLEPRQIDIEVTSKCNLQCKGCPTNLQSGAGEHMDFKLFKSIVDRVNWDCTLVPWLNGEPLLHPRYADMIQYIVKSGHRAYITTNGHYWNEKVFQTITDVNSIYQIIFSLDGIPEDWSRSIELARPGSDRVLVMKNLNKFAKLKAMKGNNIDLAVKICERGQDWEEIENYVGYFLAWPEIDFVIVGKMLDRETEPGSRIYPCRYSDNMFMVIRSDGEVVACSYHPEVHNENYFKFGNVRNDIPLLEIYNNEKMRRFRENQRNGIFEGPCKTCGFAYTGDGFLGHIQFRNEKLKEKYPRGVYWHNDYYNQFFSLVNKKVGASWKR